MPPIRPQEEHEMDGQQIDSGSSMPAGNNASQVPMQPAETARRGDEIDGGSPDDNVLHDISSARGGTIVPPSSSIEDSASIDTPSPIPVSGTQPTPREMMRITRDYASDPRWREKPLNPGQLLYSDFVAGGSVGTQLMKIELHSASELVPKTALFTPSDSTRHARAKDPAEEESYQALERNYGWMSHLHLASLEDVCWRSIMCTSMLPEHLRGALWLATKDHPTAAAWLRPLDDAIQQHTRISKHGNFFTAFAKYLAPTDKPPNFPILLSIPFLDVGQSTPLGSQEDRRGDDWTGRHFSRSVLQYFYRLEDTSNRETSQVFNKHKPWVSNPGLEKKVQGWYGHCPTSLHVEEMWVLLVDAQHVVTFTSEQALVRLLAQFNHHHNNPMTVLGYSSSNNTGQHVPPNAATVALAFITSAVGIVHRTFRSDVVLPVVER